MLAALTNIANLNADENTRLLAEANAIVAHVFADAPVVATI